MARFGNIPSETAITAGQSIRRNAGDTGWEGYTPSAGGGGSNLYNADIVVASSGGDYTTLEEAIENATSGQVIVVMNDTTESAVPSSYPTGGRVIGAHRDVTIDLSAVDWDPATEMHWENITIDIGANAMTWTDTDHTWDRVTFKRTGTISGYGLTFDGGGTFTNCIFDAEANTSNFGDFVVSGNEATVKDCKYITGGGNSTYGFHMQAHRIMVDGFEVEVTNTSNFSPGIIEFSGADATGKNITIRGSTSATFTGIKLGISGAILQGCYVYGGNIGYDLDATEVTLIDCHARLCLTGFQIDQTRACLTGCSSQGEGTSGRGFDIQSAGDQATLNGCFATNHYRGIEVDSGASDTYITGGAVWGNDNAQLSDSGTNTTTSNLRTS